MKKPKEETVSLVKYQHEVDSIRMSWSNDVQKMMIHTMKIYDSRQRLIELLESVLKNQQGVLLGNELRDKIANEIQRAKGVKL